MIKTKSQRRRQLWTVLRKRRFFGRSFETNLLEPWNFVILPQSTLLRSNAHSCFLSCSSRVQRRSALQPVIAPTCEATVSVSSEHDTAALEERNECASDLEATVSFSPDSAQGTPTSEECNKFASVVRRSYFYTVHSWFLPRLEILWSSMNYCDDSVLLLFYFPHNIFFLRPTSCYCYK